MRRKYHLQVLKRYMYAHLFAVIIDVDVEEERQNSAVRRM